MCFHLYYRHVCISLYTCANVICIKLLLTYLLNQLREDSSLNGLPYCTVQSGHWLTHSINVTGIDLHHLSWWMSLMRPWTSSTLRRYCSKWSKYCSIDNCIDSCEIAAFRCLCCFLKLRIASVSFSSSNHCWACVVGNRMSCNWCSWLTVVVIIIIICCCDMFLQVIVLCKALHTVAASGMAVFFVLNCQNG